MIPLAFFAGIFDPFVLVSLSITIVVIMALTERIGVSMATGVLLGIWGSITAIERWGGRSLFLITLVFIVTLLKEVFELKQVWVAVVSGILAQALWQQIFETGYYLPSLLIQGLLCFIVYTLMQVLSPKFGVYLKRD